MGNVNTTDVAGVTRLVIDEVGHGDLPTNALHVIAPAPGAVRIEDGNEGVGLALVDDGTGTGVGTWGVSASQPFTVRTVSINDFAVLTDNIIYVDTAGITITLYTAVGNTGRHLYIDNDSGGEITVDGNGAETIENELTQTMPTDSAMHIYSTGTEWRII